MINYTTSRPNLILPFNFSQKQVLSFYNHSHILTTRSRRIHLKMAASNSTTINNHPGIEQQKIIIQNNCGEKLEGLLHETGPKEIVILRHGFIGTKEYSMMVELAVALQNKGISAFCFDFSRNGEGTFQFGNYGKEVDDLRAVIQYFTEANRVVSDIVKMDRGIDERLRKDYLERAKKYGFIDIKSNKGEVLFRATEESLMKRLNTNMHEAGLRIDKDCRVLTIHGSSDEVIPVEDASEFAKIIPNHELRIVEGANHCYDKHGDILTLVVLSFIKNSLPKI